MDHRAQINTEINEMSAGGSAVKTFHIYLCHVAFLLVVAYILSVVGFVVVVVDQLRTELEHLTSAHLQTHTIKLKAWKCLMLISVTETRQSDHRNPQRHGQTSWSRTYH